MLEVFYILFVTSSGNIGIPLRSILALILLGFIMNIKHKFQKINPKLNIKIANALILFKSLGNWVHKQLSKGIPAMRKLRIGMVIQNIPKISKFN